MRARIAAAALAAVLASGTALAGCPPAQNSADHTAARQKSKHKAGHKTDRQDCLDLGAVSQISRQIVAGERIPAPSVANPAASQKTFYTGPTVGLSPTVHKTPTVGYRWAID